MQNDTSPWYWPRRFKLKMGDHLDSPETKRIYNEQIFTEIAPRYDFITRALSFWQDSSWKRDLVDALPARPQPFCLDLACGTGDITRLLARKYPWGDVVGLDITEPMLALARAQNAQGNVQFVNQDMSHLAFDPATADIVSGGYALRNAPDLARTLEGIHRVLKPDGVAAFLDFSKPAGPAAQRLQYWILKIWTGFWGLLLHRNHEIYAYIAESLHRFPDREQLRGVVDGKGFAVVSSRRYFFGFVELLVLKPKPDSPEFKAS